MNAIRILMCLLLTIFSAAYAATPVRSDAVMGSIALKGVINSAVCTIQNQQDPEASNRFNVSLSGCSHEYGREQTASTVIPAIRILSDTTHSAKVIATENGVQVNADAGLGGAINVSVAYP